MGEVYRAHDPKLQRSIALKVLRSDGSLATSGRARLLREARAVAALSHPNVLAVFDVGEVAEPEPLRGLTYIAMELVVGTTLRDCMVDPTVPLKRRLAWLEDVARALAAAHDAGLIHRDVKPENVMIRTDGAVKVLDFGIARSAGPVDVFASTEAHVVSSGEAVRSPLARTNVLSDSINTAPGQIVGTLFYMAPEQLRGEPLDGRADQFAWGVVAYELLTGAPPWSAPDAIATVSQILSRTPPSPAELEPRISASLSDVVMRALDKDPARRFQSMHELLAAIAASERVSAGKATSSPSRSVVISVPSATTAPSVRSVRESRVRWLLLPALAVAVGLTLVGGIGMVAWTHGRQPAVKATPPIPVAAPSARPTSYTERRLTSLPASKFVDATALTPDGTEFVFSDDDGFWIQPVGGGGRRPLGVPSIAGTSDRAISLLADGRRAFVSASDGEHVRAWLAPLDGSPAQLVHEGPGMDAWASPDGSHIAVTLRQSEELQVGAMGSATFTPVAPAHAYAATFSPDGRHIAFVRNRPASINVVAVDGSTLIRTLSDPSVLTLSVGGLAWPEAGRILFTSCVPSTGLCAVKEVAVDPSGDLREPPRELWRMRARGLQGLSFSGGRMSVVVVEERDQIRVADLAKGGRSLEGPSRAFTNDEANNRDPSWLPDGRLSFYSDRDSETALYAQGREGTLPVLLVGSPVDGRKWEGHENEALRTGEVIYQRPDDDAGVGASRIVVAVPGGPERELARVATHTDVGFVRCGGGDPARCVLGLSRESTMTLAHLDLASGRADPPIYRGTEVASFAVSPDGSQVAFVERTPEMTLIDVATGRQRKVTTTPRGRSLQDVEFTRDGKTLLLTGQDFAGGVPYGLIAVGLDGRGAMLQSSTGGAMTEPHVSFDNRRLAIVDWVVSTNAWVVEPQER